MIIMSLFLFHIWYDTVVLIEIYWIYNSWLLNKVTHIFAIFWLGINEIQKSSRVNICKGIFKSKVHLQFLFIACHNNFFFINSASCEVAWFKAEIVLNRKTLHEAESKTFSTVHVSKNVKTAYTIWKKKWHNTQWSFSLVISNSKHKWNKKAFNLDQMSKCNLLW